MLRKFVCNKFFRTSAMLMLFLLLAIFPVKKEYSLNDNLYTNQVFSNYSSSIYLLDRNDYVAKCNIDIPNEDNYKYATKLIELLIIDGKYESKIPNGFKPILPSNLKINSLKISNNVAYLDMSKDFFELSEEYEDKAIELIIYNLTSISGIDSVYILIDGQKLEQLPKSKVLLNQPLSRNYGVNKIYEETNYKDVNETTIYYVSKTNRGYYYVPVTKINNDKRNKIEIIIDELASSNTYESNLMSFLNYNAKLTNYNIDNGVLSLNFNKYIFDDIASKSILEEVVYTICLSVKDNYEVKEVVFNVNNEEILKSNLKDIE